MLPYVVLYDLRCPSIPILLIVRRKRESCEIVLPHRVSAVVFVSTQKQGASNSFLSFILHFYYKYYIRV